MRTTDVKYDGSGINILRTVADIYIAISSLCTIGFVIAAVNTDEIIYMLYALALLLSGFLFFGLFRCVATIAENALYQKTKLIEDMKFNREKEINE